VVVGDQGQREVDAGGHARRRPHRSVALVDAVGVDGDVRVAPGELARGEPVGGGAAPGEEPGLGEEQGSTAHRCGTPCEPREPPEVSGQFPVAQMLRNGQAAGDEQRVDVAVDVGQCRRGVDPDAGVGGDRPGPGGDHLDPVAAGPRQQGRRGEHVGGPGQIEQLKPVEHQAHDPPLHVLIVAAPRDGGNDTNIADPATEGPTRAAVAR
jgi:hypothetical protein